ncbi:TolC family protein [Pseudidiomarina sp. E22-M8]|uniref:TolC family protein n=1 Tax=Pseudidiomarina sp. E22-M8 TaxID=3424768 RepID=UPI00403D4A94
MYKNIVVSLVLISIPVFPASAQNDVSDAFAGTTEQQVVDAFVRQQRVEQWLTKQQEAIEADRAGAALLANPELAFSYEPMTYDDGSEENETAVWLTQRFEAWGARGYRQQAADRKAELESFRLKIKVRDQVAALRSDFYRLVLLQALYHKQQRWVDELSRLVNLSQQQLSAEEQSQLDHFRLQQELSATQLKLSQVEQKVLAKSAELEQLTGLIISDVNAPLLPKQANIETLNSLTPPTYAPELELLAAYTDNLAAEKLAAEAKALPEFSVGVGLRQIDDAQGSYSEAAVQLGIELPLFQRGQYKSARYAQLTSVVSIEKERVRRELLQQFGTLKSQLKATIRALNNARLSNTDEMLQAATEAYWLGEISVTELIDIQRTHIELSAQQLEQQFAARNYWITLQVLLQQPQENLL